MLYLSLFLVLVARAAHPRPARQGASSRLVLAVPGWACLVGGVVVLVMAEA